MDGIRKKLALLLKIVAAIGFVAAIFSAADAGVGTPAPEINGQSWLNSGPMQISGLKGKVVLVEFWTFGCYNYRNVEPYMKAWHQKYADRGLVVIGLHAPEFSYERSVTNVQRYVREHVIRYPVAIDNDFSTWKRYNNRYWPAMYLIDRDHPLHAGARRRVSAD